MLELYQSLPIDPGIVVLYKAEFRDKNADAVDRSHA
jgi:hypothetical protein